MVRKLVAFLTEVGRGTFKADALRAMLHANAAPFSPAAPPSGLFLEAVLYPGERFEKPLAAIVPVR